jgi:hypothetical protein
MNELREPAAHRLPGPAANRAPFGVAAVADVRGFAIVAAPVEMARVERAISSNIGSSESQPIAPASAFSNPRMILKSGTVSNTE